MPREIKLEDASAPLKSLTAEVCNGVEVILTQGNEPIAKLIALPKLEMKKRIKAGFAKGIITYMADDFDAPLEDFKAYM